MTLRTRNEADILDAQLSFHLDAGVDFVVAIDNGSDDGTTEILERYAREGLVDVTRDERNYQQGAWGTGMARRAGSGVGGALGVKNDAGGVWGARGGWLKD